MQRTAPYRGRLRLDLYNCRLHDTQRFKSGCQDTKEVTLRQRTTVYGHDFQDLQTHAALSCGEGCPADIPRTRASTARRRFSTSCTSRRRVSARARARARVRHPRTLRGQRATHKGQPAAPRDRQYRRSMPATCAGLSDAGIVKLRVRRTLGQAAQGN